MLHTVECPKCGAKQKGLDLEETGGSFICSCCKKQVFIDIRTGKEKSEENK